MYIYIYIYINICIYLYLHRNVSDLDLRKVVIQSDLHTLLYMTMYAY